MKIVLAVLLIFGLMMSVGMASKSEAIATKKIVKKAVAAVAAYPAPNGEWTIPAYIGGNMSYFFKADGTVRIFCEEGGIDWACTWKVSGKKLTIRGEGASVWTFKDANTLISSDREILKKK